MATTNASRTDVPTLAEIEEEMKSFEIAERKRLGLEERPATQWHDPNPQIFTKAQRAHTTILLGGLTIAQDAFVRAGLEGIGYQIEVLPCPDTKALHLGKEFGNRGQCNPTYFTVGNLIKRLVSLRDEDKLPVPEIVSRYVFMTAGACGPCRFGTYATEYRKALRDAGFEGFRVLLFQQQGGFKQATGSDVGLELTPRFFMQIVKAIVAGDVLNAIGYRIRPYEVTKGDTDAALERCKDIMCEALRTRKSSLLALRRCRKELERIPVDRLQAKPKVMIIGEFWAMTTEGDGNYHLQRFLEQEGAEVEVQAVSAWLLYMIWQGQRDTRRRLELKEKDEAGKGLAKRNAPKLLRRLWAADCALRFIFQTAAHCIGLKGFHLPDMEEVASLAQPHYDVELRGGEGHMEVGKLIEATRSHRAHMIVSVKPFGCMPSSGVSDGIQSLVATRHPEIIFCPVETTGDGAVNFQSRVLMCLFRARRKAREEYDIALKKRGLTAEEALVKCRSGRHPFAHAPHVTAGSAANMVLAMR
ncbi:putative nucleotide-binding protein (sugar kinase/HSP70/actin superfamily) [Roseimicrobium gellanilyticum]|uniref:Putative nucleotide-binding protein (Sugar kinase/HSP70/actin superfamily) n=1 Tax=Roseimicrobium gellanilyticum TaxID=748857 RepID=A0A366HPT6_9BACT|nr:2-hydroxyglutaryl-CoA dehydratase [Roseimicrobium gellanilyticum]RBP45371.1 putative nucleotide-binding protein (sugar kinase/HSP70/actin superfamily) [Roseimicrobium gellanilyticum]